MTKEKNGFGRKLREGFRKSVVSLKRQPSGIPLAVFALAFLIFSLNLTDISDTTAKIQGSQMGLCSFAIMLFSILLLVCFLNAFPKRKKANVPMLVLVFVMLGLVVFADAFYLSRIWNALTREQNPIAINDSTLYIATALRTLRAHLIVLGAGFVLTVTLPLYRKWLQKIDTSVAVEENSSLGAIELSDEE